MYLFLISVVSATCPEWKCKTLNSSICAQLHGYQIYTNNITCPRDLFCKYSDFNTWYQLQSPSSAKMFNCTRQNYNGFSIDQFTGLDSFFCGFRNPNDELANGAHPKVCSQDYDCLTKGGWMSKCACGLNGMKYCVAELGSSAYDQYWKKCYSPPGSRSDPKISAVEKAYWDLYSSIYVQIISAPPCAKNLLWEFRILKDLDSFRNMSLGRGLYIFWIFSMIFYI